MTIDCSRRQIILSALALTAPGSGAFAQTVPAVRHPDPRTIESGDLLWTAEPGAFIPYSTGGGRKEQEAEWIASRDAAVAALRLSSNPADVAAAQALSTTTFKSFQAGYIEDTKPDEFRTYSATGFAVGHIAIADADASGLHVIEARPNADVSASAAYTRFKNGVVRTTYAKWVASNEKNLIWHGRLANVSAKDRAEVAARTRRRLGRDYWFWSLDLADTESFYCSKLIWQATREALGLALDGEAATKRLFWVSPKRLMRSASIDMKFSPAPYGR